MLDVVQVLILYSLQLTFFPQSVPAADGFWSPYLQSAVSVVLRDYVVLIVSGSVGHSVCSASRVIYLCQFVL